MPTEELQVTTEGDDDAPAPVMLSVSIESAMRDGRCCPTKIEVTKQIDFAEIARRESLDVIDVRQAAAA